MGKTTSRAAGYLMAISGGVLWAVAGACGQELYRVNTITTGWLIPIRLLCAGAIFLLLAKLQGHPILPVWRGRKNALQLLLYGCFGVSASQYTFYACIEYANVAFSTVLCYICPIFILLFSLIKGLRAPKLYEVSAVVLVVVGVRMGMLMGVGNAVMGMLVGMGVRMVMAAGHVFGIDMHRIASFIFS